MSHVVRFGEHRAGVALFMCPVPRSFLFFVVDVYVHRMQAELAVGVMVANACTVIVNLWHGLM